jgi:hypothetical protein
MTQKTSCVPVSFCPRFILVPVSFSLLTMTPDCWSTTSVLVSVARGETEAVESSALLFPFSSLITSATPVRRRR